MQEHVVDSLETQTVQGIQSVGRTLLLINAGALVLFMARGAMDMAERDVALKLVVLAQWYFGGAVAAMSGIGLALAARQRIIAFMRLRPGADGSPGLSGNRPGSVLAWLATAATACSGLLFLLGSVAVGNLLQGWLGS